MALLQCNVRSA